MGLTEQERKHLRRRCQTDLFFLAKNVMKKDLEEQPHKEVCSFFVHKDPEVKYTAWSESKERLLMIPRGSFKSTLNVVDCVQAIICDPEIRILILTAERNLSEAFISELRDYFIVRDDPTEFQALFPEFCISQKEKSSALEFITPARTKFRKEPTAWASSVNSQLPGWHMDMLKLDDVVNNINAAEQEQIDKIIAGYNYARKLVDPGGYIDIIGTPYAPNDLYTHVREKAEEGDLAVLAKPAWTLKPGSEKKDEKDRTEEDYDYFFPARLTHKFLKKEQKRDPDTFDSQYLISARSNKKYIFTEEMIHGAIIPWQSIPKNLKYFAAWDLNYKQGVANNQCAGLVVAVDEQSRLYLIDLSHGRFGITDLCFQIADTMRRYPLQLTAIEDVNGAQWLGPEIDRQAAKLSVQSKIYWLPVDRTKDAKILRISRLVPLFEQNRLFISSSCSYLETVISMFTNFTGSKNAQDDIPDALSFFPRFINVNPMRPTTTEEIEREIAKIKANALKDILYGSGAQDFVPLSEAQPEKPDYNNYF